MEKIKDLVEIAGQSQHMPALLSLLVGLVVLKKRPWIFFADDEASGDNIPASLMDGIGR